MVAELRLRVGCRGQIDELEVEVDVTRAPVFGDADTPLDDVNEFYQHWKSFVTVRSFAWMDEYRTVDAPTRQVRRAMEKENKKLRDAARKAFTTEVRELAEFAYRRDRRVLAFQKQKEKEREQQRREDENKKRERQAAYDAERRAFKEQERERWAAGGDSFETSRVTDAHIAEEMDKLRKKLDAELFVCDLCNKTFKSTKQLQNHLTSKKHRDMEAELGVSTDFDLFEAEMERELQDELAAAGKLKTNDADTQLEAEVASLSVDEGDVDAQSANDAASPEVDEEEELKRQEAERIRLEKDQKAAEKRKERKEKRKEKKKEGVDKIVSAAKAKKDKDEEELEEDGRRRGKKGGRKARR